MKTATEILKLAAKEGSEADLEAAIDFAETMFEEESVDLLLNISRDRVVGEENRQRAMRAAIIIRDVYI